MRCLSVMFAAALAAAPLVAQAEENLDCVASGYTADERAAMNGHVASYRYVSGAGASDAEQSIGIVATEVVQRCATEFGWSEDAFILATMNEYSRQLERGLRENGQLDGDLLRQIDGMLLSDGGAIWPISERMVMSALGEGDGMTEADSEALTVLAERLGIADEPFTQQVVGALLGAMAMQRIGRRLFAAS